MPAILAKPFRAFSVQFNWWDLVDVWQSLPEQVFNRGMDLTL
jgi:hypothetical protein